MILGLLHLAVTKFISAMVRDAATPDAADWLLPPMLLNHIVVGILLLPLGFLTAYAAPHAARDAGWALAVCRSTSMAVATLPLVLLGLMGTRYLAAPLFVIAIGIVCVASVALLLATFWPRPRRALDPHRPGS